MKRKMFFALFCLMLFTCPYLWANKLYVDSIPSGAKVWVAEKDEFSEKNDYPKGEENYKGVTPLVVDVGSSVYAVHIQIPLSAFEPSELANAIIQQYAENFKKSQSRGAYAAGSPPKSPFMWSGSNTTTYSYGDNSSGEPNALGHLYYADCKDGDSRCVGIWWPKLLSFEDMEPFMPPEDIYPMGESLAVKLKNKYGAGKDEIEMAVNTMQRTGMAAISFDDPSGKPYVVNLVMWLDPPSKKIFAITEFKEAK